MTDLQPADWELPVAQDPKVLASIEADHARINEPGVRDALETRKTKLEAELQDVVDRLASLTTADPEPAQEEATESEPEEEAEVEEEPKPAAKKPATRKAPAKKVDKADDSA